MNYNNNYPEWYWYSLYFDHYNFNYLRIVLYFTFTFRKFEEFDGMEYLSSASGSLRSF